jgi:cysteine desulfurase
LIPEARQAWLEATEKYAGNPSSPHRLGLRAEAALDEARERLAAMLGCAAGDLLWTSGATESNNLALYQCASAAGNRAGVWVSATEHPSVLQPARRHTGAALSLIPAQPDGRPDLDWVQSRLRRSRPALVAVMAANNETGVLQPWKEILELCRERGVPFFCDAVQWLGKLPAVGLGECDYLSGCAHKFGGPRGVGFLKVPRKPRAKSLLHGGPQEDGRRAGTENLPGILSLVAALAARGKVLDAGGHHARQSWKDAFELALKSRLPEVKIIAECEKRLWNTVSAVMPPIGPQQRWVVKLDKAGFAVSTGSACSSGNEKMSHVLEAMGLAPSEAARVVRFSSGWETTREEWETLLDAMVGIHAGVAKKSV